MAFTTTHCVALTWAADRKCYGVRIRRKGDRCRIVRAWASTPESGDSVSVRLGEGARELGASDADTVLVGRGGASCGLVDVTVPPLQGNELRNALAFELAKHAPVPSEKLAWGYRITGTVDKRQLRVRIAYMRTEAWNNWVDELRNLGTGVDMLIPPIAVLDPLLAEDPVVFRDGDFSFLFRPAGSDGRELVPRESGGNDTVVEDPADIPGVELAALADQESAERTAFMETVILGVYGSSGQARRDQRTWLSVPYDIKPRRNRLGRVAAVLLVTYLLGTGAVFAARYYTAAREQYETLETRCAALRDTVIESRSAENPLDSIRTLSRELAEARISRPSMTTCLMELTQLTQRDIWVRHFNWNEGKITVEMVTELEDVDVLEVLEGSPVLNDVYIQYKKVDPKGTMTLRLQMYAAFTQSEPETAPKDDVATETLQPPPPPPPVENE